MKKITLMVLFVLMIGLIAGNVWGAENIVVASTKILDSNTIEITFVDPGADIASCDGTKVHIDVGDGASGPLDGLSCVVTDASAWKITVDFGSTPFSNSASSYSAAEGLYLDALAVSDSTDTNAVVGHAASTEITDGQSPTISSTAPATNAFIKTQQVSYTLSEAVSSGAIVFTRTSGTADSNSPHTCTLQGTALSTGAHTDLALATDANACVNWANALVDGSVYTVTYDGSDAATNAATTITNTGVTYDTTAPTMDSAQTKSTTTIDVTFSEDLDVATIATGDFSVASNSVSGVAESSGVVTLTLGTPIATDATPVVTLINTQSVSDLAGNSVTGDGTATYDKTPSDGIAPTISSVVTGENGVGLDKLTITFSENVDATTTDGTGWTVTGTDAGGRTITANSDPADASNTMVLTLSSAFVSENPDATITYTNGGGNLVDASSANNELASGASPNIADGIKPTITDFAYEDNDGDGKIDRVIVSFSETVVGASTMGYNDLEFTNVGDFTGAAFGTVSNDFIGSSVASVTINLITEASAVDTEENSGNIAISTYNSYSLQDASGNTNSVLGAQTQATFTDSAEPVIKDFAYQDNDGDGKVDQFVVTYSEQVTGASVLSANDLLITNVGHFTSIAFGNDATDLITSDSTTTTIVLGTESTAVDTRDDASALAIMSQNSFSLTDGTNTNADIENQEQATFSDSAKPIITNLEIEDTSGDGLIDKVIATWSETIDTDDSATPVGADFGTLALPDGSSAVFTSASFTDPGATSNSITITGITGQTTKNTASASTAISGDLSTKWVDGSSNAPHATYGTANEAVTDSAAPVISSFTYQDNDGNGKIDRFLATFSETVSSASILKANDLTLSNVGDFTGAVIGSDSTDLITSSVASVTVVLGNEATVKDTKENSGNIEITTQNTFSLTDGANQNSVLAAQSGATFIDGAAPVISDFAYLDNDGDGRIDRITATYTETVTSASVLKANDLAFTNVGDFTSAAFGTDATDLITDSVTSTTISLGTESIAQDTKEGTGLIAISSQNTFSLTDGTNTNSVTGAQGQASFTDSAAPVISDFAYQDNDGDGKIDRFVASFTETLDAASVLAANDLSLTNVDDFTSAAFGTDNTDLITSGVSSVTVVLGTESTAQDTKDSGSLAISSQNAFSLTDGTNTNSDTEAQTQASFTDSAAPVISDFAYQDNDGDGKIDRFVASFTETLDAASVLAANDLSLTNVDDFTSAAFGTDNTDLITSGVSSVTVVLGTESTAQDTKDSGSLAISSQNAFSLTDGTNTNSDTEAQTQASFTDNAAPVISDFAYQDSDYDSMIDRFVVSFTEDVTSASVLGASDLSLTNVGDFTSAAFGALTTDLITTSVSSVTVPLGTESTAEDTNEGSGNIAISTQGSFSLTDGTNINNAKVAQTQASFTDSAAPAINDLDIYDTNNDGLIDKVVLTWSENLDTDSSNPPVAGDFGTIVLPDGQNADLSGASFTDPAHSAATVTITGLTGQLTKNTAVGSTAINGITNEWTDGTNPTVNPDDSETITDSASPVPTAIETKDIGDDGVTANGYIDHLKVTFSENIDDSAINNYNAGTDYLPTSLAVTNYANAKIDANDAVDSENDQYLYVVFTEGSAYDTDTTSIDLTWTGASILIKDASANTVADLTSGYLAETDGAGAYPFSIVATGTNTVRVEWTEDVYDNADNAGSAARARHYTIQTLNDNPTTATVANNKVDLTFGVAVLPGTHTLDITTVQDNSVAHNTMIAQTGLTIIGGPTVHGMEVNKNPTQGTTVNLTGLATTSTSTVKNVTYCMLDEDGTKLPTTCDLADPATWTAFVASDGTFDEASETFEAENIDISTLDDETITVHIRAQDAMNAWGAEDAYITFTKTAASTDIIAPSIDITSPNTVQTVTKPGVSITYSDAFGVDTSSVIVKIDGTDVTSDFSVTATSASVGVNGLTSALSDDAWHTVYVYVADAAGNFAETTWSFKVDTSASDTTAPRISSFGPTTVQTASNPTIYVDAQDETTSEASLTVEYSQDGSVLSAMTYDGVTNNRWEQAITLADDSTSTIMVKVSDAAGNTVYQTYEVSV
ncbi:hypothetical protein K9M79_06015, partial [Candidatus Woesearchaeota archaeon]|nr:hypothetical protein [Candidatus Woesearchaeota archaeon]